MKRIDLETLNGEDFERLCQEIFTDYYGLPVEITPLVGDGGKDLIIHGDQTIYVECKHHKASIGRPVVQKLHSAMVTDWVQKGIIVTTGTFSPEAKSHVKHNNLPIELIDGKKLESMAMQVGIELYFGYNVNIPEEIIVKPSGDEIKNLIDSILSHIKTSPKTIKEIYLPLKRVTNYKTYYVVDYVIKQEFYNSKKDQLLYDIDDTGNVILEINSLAPIDHAMEQFYSKAKFVDVKEDIISPKYEIKHTRLEVEDCTHSLVRDKYSTEIAYTTTNNQNRTKKIIPTKNHIQLSNIRIIHIPSISLDYSLMGRKFHNDFWYNGYSFSIVEDFKCEICNNTMQRIFFCNDCKKVVCANHQTVCTICGKTLCSECMVKYKAGLIKTQSACHQCMIDNPQLKMKKPWFKLK